MGMDGMTISKIGFIDCNTIETCNPQGFHMQVVIPTSEKGIRLSSPVADCIWLQSGVDASQPGVKIRS